MGWPSRHRAGRPLLAATVESGGVMQPDWQGSARDYLEGAAGTPQPPGQAPAQPGQLTLGQANPQGPQPQNPYLAQFQQALQATQQIFAPARRQLIPDPGPMGPGRLLAAIVTGGVSEGQRNAYRNAYNMKAQQQNALLDVKSAELAKEMVNAQASQDLAQTTSSLRQQALQLQILNLQRGLKNDALVEANRQWNRDFKTTVGAPTPGGLEAEEAAGLGRAPSGIPGRQKLVPMQGGGWAGAAPGSPIAQAGGPTEGEASAADTPAARLRATRAATEAQKQQARAATLTSQQKGQRDAATSVLGLVGDVEGAMEGMPGPPMSWARSAKVRMGFADPAFKNYKTTLALLKTKLMQMHTGSRSSEMIFQHFGQLLNPEESPENAKSTLAEVKKYANSILSEHAPQGAPVEAQEAPTGKQRITLDQLLNE